MKLKSAYVFIALLITSLLLFPTNVLGCVLTLKPSAIEVEIGESVTFTLTRILTHKNCILPLEETRYEVKGGTIVSISKWITSSQGDTQEIIVRFDSVGEGSLKVIRDCSKGGLMTVTTTIKVVEKPSLQPPPPSEPPSPVDPTPQPTQPTPTQPTQTINPTTGSQTTTSKPTTQQDLAKVTEPEPTVSAPEPTLPQEPSDISETNDPLINETLLKSDTTSNNENTGFAWFKNLLTIQNGIILILLLLGSFIFTKKSGRYLRGVSLIVSLALLGFYYEGCPCLVSYIDRILVLPFGSTLWIAIAVSLAIIILFTLIRGRVYCGYVCPMGAAQEFLFNEKRSIKIPQKAYKYSRFIKYIVLAGIIIYALITSKAIYCSLDPFKVMFNFSGSGFPLYLLVIVILSSLFIYRPFCQALCPMGAMLSIISRVGKIIGINYQRVSLDCVGCKLCNRVCPVDAIEVKDKTAVIKSGECVSCGQCFEKCPK